MADRKPLVFLSDNSVGELPASDSVSWAWLSDVPEFATRWPTWDEVTGKPAIPSGTVTSVSAGDGMLFSTITGSGEVTLGYPAQVSPTSLSEVTSGSHSHSFSSLFSDTSAFTADHAPDQYPSSVVSLSRVGSLAGTGWPSNGVAANFMTYGNRYGQLYFETTNNKLFFRTSNSNTSWSGDLEEVYHTGNDGAGSGLDADYLRGMWADQSAQPETVASRDEGGDLHARLFHTGFDSFGGSSISSGASLAYRNNSTSDDAIRFASNPAAIRGWLNLGSSATWDTTTADVASTVALRDGSADIRARLFRSSFPSQSVIPASASIAYRGDDSDNNYIRFCDSPDALRGWMGLGSAATTDTGDFASSSNFNYIGGISGGSYYDYLPSNRGVSYMFHAAGNSPTDAPASPARQTAVLGMDTTWGTTQLAITNENTPQVFVRGNGATPWNRVWTAGDFNPSTKFDNPSGTTAQYIRGNGSLATFPSIPSSSDYVATSGNQSGLSGNKTWSGTHTWNSGSVTSIQAIRNNSNVNSLFQATTNRGSVYFGYGNASSSDHFAAGTSNNLTGSALFFYADSSGLISSGTVSDSDGDVRKLKTNTANTSGNISASSLNGSMEKSNNSSYTWTIPSGLGSQGDAITFVNSGTSGNVTIARGSGVSLYRNGTNANITVGPGSMVTIYRSATANRWIA